MAKTSNARRDSKLRSRRIAPSKRVVYLSQPEDCFDLRSIIEDASRCGVREIELRVVYADYREPGFNPTAAMECVRLCDFLNASYLITQYGYRLRMETTDANLSFGRKAVTLEFVKEGNHDVYPEPSRSN